MPADTVSPRRVALVAILAPVLCVAPIAAALYLDPDLIHRSRDVLAGIAVAAVGFYVARKIIP